MTKMLAIGLKSNEFCEKGNNITIQPAEICGNCGYKTTSNMLEYKNSITEKGGKREMIKGKRGISLLLTLALLCSMLAPAAALGDEKDAGATASLAVTLRFDYLQRMDEVERRAITVTLADAGGNALGAYNLSADEKTGFENLAVERVVKNQDGGVWSGEPNIGYYDLYIDGLPAGGAYTLLFAGEGYVDCSIEQIKFNGFSKHFIIGTQDKTFTVGDVDGDGQVTASDRDEIAGVLGQTPAGALSKYDLNGDGKLDIVDLAYVNHNIDAAGGADEKETAMIVSADLFDADVTAEKVTLVDADERAATVADLLQSGKTVKVISNDNSEPLTLPIEFQNAADLSRLEIVSPEIVGAEGAVEIEVEGEEAPLTFALDGTRPAGIDLLSTDVVVINLGKRVPVKKITITVDQVEGKDGIPSYITIEEIKFLKDIVPDNPTPPYNKVTSVAAAAGDKQVTLTWPELPNWSGYRVEYGTSPNNYTHSVRVDAPTAVITNLENLTTYYFIVTPVDDLSSDTGRQAQPSDEVSATPQPAAAPDAPDHTTVTSMDGALHLTWGKSKNATHYRVYYKAAGEDSYHKAPDEIQGTAYTVAGLTNGTEYSLYVTACNTIGESRPGTAVLGTPQGLDNTEPAGIPAGGRMDRENLASIVMTDPGNYDTEQYPNGGFTIQNVADGDYSTHWTSQSYNHGNWSRDKGLTFAFKNPMDMSYVVWVPRQDGTYRNNLRTYTITVYDADNNETVVAKDVPVKGSPATTGYAVLPFAPTRGIAKISIKIEQVGYSAVSLSEIIFFDYDAEKDLSAQAAALFTDGSMTALRETVTADQIAALESKLADPETATYCFGVDGLKDELELAQALLAGDTSKLGVVLTGIQSRSGSAAGNNGQGGSTLQPLGVVAAAGQEISVYASGIPSGEAVNLLATQYDAEASAWQASMGRLENGRNVLTVPQIGTQAEPPRGGSLYLTYEGAQGAQIKIQVRRAMAIPVLELSSLDLSAQADAAKQRIAEYLAALEAYLAGHTITNAEQTYLNSTELSLKHVLLSIPAQSVSKTLNGLGTAEQVERLYQSALAWEQLMEISCKTQGIDDNAAMETRQNIRYMQMFAGAFMYAAGSHIGVGYGSCSGLVSGSPVETMVSGDTKNRLFGWGIAHEIGHNMDKLGKAEITNNIYSLMVQTYDGNANTLSSRLETSGKYASIFQKTAAGYPGASNDVFVQLGMYWQLHLAFDEADDPLRFYHAFFKLWKQGGLDGAYTYDEKVAVTASKAAGVDLSAFFTRWGMRLGDAAKQEIAASAQRPDDRALWYLNDESRRYRLRGGQKGVGSVTLHAAPGEADPREVVLNFSSDAGAALQGYEIRRNGKPIAFTDAETYTDIIGSANNQAFDYTVAAYDKLGYEIAVSSAADVLVAYDKTVDPAAYTLTQDDNGDVHFRVKDGTTVVSGFKITATAPLTGAYSVTVTDAQGQSMTARTGDFSQGNLSAQAGQYLAYLNKPGASSQDTRIWPYDAQEVTISGLPAGFVKENVSLVSYAGDQISLKDGMVMAKLASEYAYDDGNGGTETIPEDTVVILGSYRGDPIFNDINIAGEYVTISMGEDAGEDKQTSSTETHDVPGTVLMFAEVPESGPVCDISDGFFLFIPTLRAADDKDPLAQDRDPSCAGSYGLPTRIQAKIFRLDDPYDPSKGKRLTGSTIWVDVPSLDSLPSIVLTGTEVQP